MSTALTKGLPTFPTALLSRGPIFTGNFALPLNLTSNNDPFASSPSGFQLVEAAGHPASLKGLSADSVDGSRIRSISAHPAQRLRMLKGNITKAKEAALAGDAQSFETSVREALQELRRPAASDTREFAKPLYMHIERGSEILNEAALAAAGFSSEENLPENLNWLHNFSRDSSSEKDPIDVAKAGLLRAYNTMRHAMSAENPPSALLSRALQITGDVVNDFDASAAPLETKKQAHFFADLLRVEVLANKLILAVHRRDRKSRKEIALDIKNIFRNIRDEHNIGDEPLAEAKDPSKVEMLAKYYADVSILMARLGLWKESLERARTLTTKEGLKETQHAKRLIDDPLFADFIDFERGRWGEIKQAGEIRRDASHGSISRFLRAGLANSHSNGLMQSAIVGGAGLISGNLLDAYLQGGHGAIAAMGGAVLFSGIYRFINGLYTSEAQDALSIGAGKPSSHIQLVKDFGKLFVKSGMDAAAWSLPAYMLDAGTDTLVVAWDTIANGYGKMGGWLVGAADAATSADTYIRIADGAASAFSDPGSSLQTLFHGYQGAAALLTAAHLMLPSLRKHSTNALLAAIMPGAISMGADSAMWALQSSPVELLNGAYNLYTKAAGLIFASHILLPKLRPDLDKISKWFFLGAIGLSADIRAAYKHDIPLFAPDFNHSDWINGVFRASIVSAEALFMMLLTGMINWQKGETRLGTLKNFSQALWDSNKSMAITIAIVNGITSPFGGAMQKQKYDQLGLIMTQGLATALGVLPFTLLISGFLKGKVPFITSTREAWQDTAGQPVHKRIAESVLGLGDAFTMPYSQNRLFRIFGYDIIGATARTWLGWDDGYLSQLAMSAPNIVAGNSASTLTWPEPSGSKWERSSVRDLLGNSGEELRKIEESIAKGRMTEEQADKARQAVMDNIHTVVTKASQRMDPLHLLRGHNRFRDATLPLYAIKQTVKPSDFPTQTNGELYASIHRMLKGGNIHAILRNGEKQIEELDSEQLGTLLQYLETFASDIDSYKVMQPLIVTLAMARDNPEFSHQINDFFDRNPWMTDLLNADISRISPPSEISRRRVKRAVMNAVATPNHEYLERVKSHGKRLDLDTYGDGLFSEPPGSTTPPPASAARPAEPQSQEAQGRSGNQVER